MASDSGFEVPSDSPLAARSARGAIVTVGAQAARFGLGLGGTAILARLLSPHEFGIVAGVTAALGLFNALRELGLGAATVQRNSISTDQASTLFWVHLAVGLASWALLALAAPAIGWLLDEPRAAGLAAALALTLPLGALATQHRALLQRRFAFSAVARSDLSGLAIGTVAACAAALAGAGVWALVVAPLASEAVTLALLWRASGWRPGRPRRGAGTRELLRFGGEVTLATALQQLARHLDKLLIGAVFGATALGFYSRAHHVALLPFAQLHAPLANVAIPTLARLQTDPARFRAAYLRALRLAAIVGLPIMVALIVLAEDLTRIVLGEAWLPAAPLLAVFACAAYGQVIGNPAGWLFLSLGHTRALLRWTGLLSGSLSLAFLVGLPFGPLGVAIAYAVMLTALRVPHFAIALAHSPVSGGDVWRAVGGAVAISAACAVAMLFALDATWSYGSGWRSVAALAACACVAVLGMLLWAPARGDVRAVLSALRDPSRVDLGANLAPVESGS